jgi:uncharacterized protein YheU (UPF0270 family)
MKSNPHEKIIDHHEQGVDVPYDQIEPETLRNMIQEFVTRDGADWGEPGGALEDKIAQVIKLLKNKQVKVVFDLNSKTANIVPCQ